MQPNADPRPVLPIEHTAKELPALAIRVKVTDERFVAYDSREGAPLALLKKPEGR